MSNKTGLQSVYEKYRAHGLEILAFPSNEFGGQEPGARDQIRDFARNAYHATFPVFDKVSVNGAGAHPVWRYLRRELPEAQGGGGGKADGRDLPWNFQKILVDQRGRPVKLLGAPWDQAEVENAVYDLLLAGEAEYEAWAAQHQQQHSQQQHSQQQHH
jgi:glutathione peroxidase